MKQCPYCHVEINEDQDFCAACSTELGSKYDKLVNGYRAKNGDLRLVWIENLLLDLQPACGTCNHFMLPSCPKESEGTELKRRPRINSAPCEVYEEVAVVTELRKELQDKVEKIKAGG